LAIEYAIRRKSDAAVAVSAAAVSRVSRGASTSPPVSPVATQTARQNGS